MPRRERSHLSREDCLAVFERFAKLVQRQAESSASIVFGEADPGQLDVTFRVSGKFGVAGDLFEAIRVLAGHKIVRENDS